MAKKQDFDNENKGNSSNGGHQYFNLEDKAIFDEVDEELRNEKFKQLINKYGGAILTLIVLVLAKPSVMRESPNGRYLKPKIRISNTQKLLHLLPTTRITLLNWKILYIQRPVSIEILRS